MATGVKDLFYQHFTAAGERRKVRILILIIYNLTICARNTYSIEDLTPKGLRGINELMHQVIPRAFPLISIEGREWDDR